MKKMYVSPITFNEVRATPGIVEVPEAGVLRAVRQFTITIHENGESRIISVPEGDLLILKEDVYAKGR